MWVVGLLERQEFLYGVDVSLVDDCEVVKVTFLLFGLLGENVAVVSVFSLDFS